MQAAVRTVVRWAGLRPGDTVLLLDALDSRHARLLRELGLVVRPATGLDVAGGLCGDSFAAALLFESTVFTFWEVEEIHRLRLRAIHGILRPGGHLIFGSSDALGKAPLEWERIVSLYSASPEGSAALRRLARNGRFAHYQVAQAAVVLEQCGFELVGVHNGFADAGSYSHWEPGMVFVCRRR